MTLIDFWDIFPSVPANGKYVNIDANYKRDNLTVSSWLRYVFIRNNLISSDIDHTLSPNFNINLIQVSWNTPAFLLLLIIRFQLFPTPHYQDSHAS